GQAGAMGDLLVAQHAFAGMEGAEDVEPTGERGDELAVLGRHAFAQAAFGRALQRRSAGDKMANISHGVPFSSCERSFIFVWRKLPCAAAPLHRAMPGVAM